MFDNPAENFSLLSEILEGIMNKYVEIVEQEFRPYDELRSISYYALKRAEAEEFGRTFECVTSIVFDAFCLESYLNHLGDLKLCIIEFREYEKRSPKEKLNWISPIINFPINIKCLPFCHFGIIFNFRDEIVHAKTDRIGPQRVMLDKTTSLPRFPKTVMERVPTLDNARKFLDSTTNMVIQLNYAAGITSPAFGHPYDAFWVG